MKLTKILNGLFSLPDRVTILQIHSECNCLYIEYKGEDYKIEYSNGYLSVEHSDGTFLTYTVMSKMIKETIENYKYATSN